VRVDIRQKCVVLCFAFFPIPLHAQWTDSSSVNTPVAVVAGDQQLPAAVSDGAGGAVITWVDRRISPSDPDLFGQRLDENGYALWTPGGGPVCSLPGEQTDPVAVSDMSGGALVAWVDHRGASRDIFAQRLSHEGALLWPAPGNAVVTAAGDQLSPRAVTDNTGGAIIVWQDGRNGAGDVYAQRLDAAGATLWMSDGIPVCTAPGSQYDVTAVADGTGGVFIGWADERSGGADVYVQHLDSSGVSLWAADGIPAVSLPEQQYKPALVPDASGGVIVAWVDWRTTDTEIYIQRISASGIPLWAGNGLFVRHDVQNQLALVADGSGGALVGLVDTDGSSLNIYVSRLDSTGASVWFPSVAMVSNGDPAQLGSLLQMLPDGHGGGIVVWADSRTAPGWDLYAQRFNGAGVPQWELPGRPVATAAFFQGSQCLLSDQRGGAVVVFEDNRTLTNDDVYAQRIRSDGSLTVSTAIGLSAGWNLVSVPRHVPAMAVDSLFPGAVSAFSFTETGYQSTTMLSPGQGAWVRVTSGGIFEFDGPALDSIGLDVPVGNRWVILGSPAGRVPVSMLRSVPPGAVLPGSVYEFDGARYVRATAFFPGKAYWVFVTQPCSLSLRIASR
jgi:hypothetical protein